VEDSGVNVQLQKNNSSPTTSGYILLVELHLVVFTPHINSRELTSVLNIGRYIFFFENFHDRGDDVDYMGAPSFLRTDTHGCPHLPLSFALNTILYLRIICEYFLFSI